MDTISSTIAASDLGRSLPRLHRFMIRLGGGARNERGWVRIDAEAMSRLRRRFRSVLVIAGLARSEVQVLVALSRHPRGLASVRQTALAARVSRTPASRALVSLEHAGLARHVATRLFDGEVKDRDVHTIDWRSPAWRTLAPVVASTALPERARAPRQVRRLPPRLARDLWIGDWRSIDVAARPIAVAHRIVHEARDDPEALAFLGGLPVEAVRNALGG